MKNKILYIFGGMKVYSKRTQFTLKLLCLSAMIFLLGSSSAFAQGSIFGAVTNSDVSTPVNGEISFVGYLDDASVIAWTIKSIYNDLEDFIGWEKSA